MPFADPVRAWSVSTGFPSSSDRFGVSGSALSPSSYNAIRSCSPSAESEDRIALFPVLSGISAVRPSISPTLHPAGHSTILTKSQIQIYRILLQRIPCYRLRRMQRNLLRHTIAIQIQLRRCLSFCPPDTSNTTPG